jgi:hypothetical protein
MSSLVENEIRKLLGKGLREELRSRLEEFSIVQLPLSADALAVRDDGVIFAARAIGTSRAGPVVVYMMDEWFKSPIEIFRTGTDQIVPTMMDVDKDGNIWLSTKSASGFQGKLYKIGLDNTVREVYSTGRADTYFTDLSIVEETVLLSENAVAGQTTRWHLWDGSQFKIIHEAPAAPRSTDTTGAFDVFKTNIFVVRPENGSDYFKRMSPDGSNVVDMPAIRHIYHLRSAAGNTPWELFASGEYLGLRIRRVLDWETTTPSTDAKIQLILSALAFPDVRSYMSKPWYPMQLSPTSILYTITENFGGRAGLIASPDFGDTWATIIPMNNSPGVSHLVFWRGYVLAPLQYGWYGFPYHQSRLSATLAFKEPSRPVLEELKSFWADLLADMNYNEIGTTETQRTVRVSALSPNPYMAIPCCCMRGYSKATIIINNTTNQSISVRLVGTMSPVSTFGEEGSGAEYEQDIATISVAAGSKARQTVTDVFEYIFAYVSASVAPTTGSLRIYVQKSK